MSDFTTDKSFTDYVHRTLAHKWIYQRLGWEELSLNKAQQEVLDLQKGIDYVVENSFGRRFYVQERFRDEYARAFSDCTLRYRRDHHADKNQHRSEFYKIRADFLVYGITNGSKHPQQRHTITGFIKFVVIDLHVLFEKIQQGQIIFQKNINFSRIENGKMLAPIKENPDDSSSFVAFDVLQLQELFGKDDIILLQEGFF